MLVLISVIAAPPVAGDAHAEVTQEVCPANRLSEIDGFADLAGSPHEASANCLALWGITGGVQPGVFGRSSPTTRAQMASLLTRFITAVGGVMPTNTPDAFDDDGGFVHESAINALAAAGIVQGTGDRQFSPREPVTRGQMATFVVRALTYLDVLLTADGDYFSDDAPPHESAINVAATNGIVGGVRPGTYEPNVSVTRAAAASILGRSLKFPLAGTDIEPPPYLRWSGSAIAVKDNRSLIEYDVGTQTSRTIYTSPNALLGPRPSPRGDRIMVFEYSADWRPALTIINRDGTGRRTFPIPAGNVGCCYEWAPDGRHLAVPLQFGAIGIGLMDSQTGAVRELPGAGSGWGQANSTWAADGKSILVAGTEGQIGTEDQQAYIRLVRSSDGVLLSEQLGPFFGNEDGGSNIDVSARFDRAMFLAEPGPTSSVLANPLTLETAANFQTAFGWEWSPGGSRAIGRSQNSDESFVTHVIDARDGSARQFEDLLLDLPAWAPDGASVISAQCRRNPDGSSLAYCDRLQALDTITGQYHSIELGTHYSGWEPVP